MPEVEIKYDAGKVTRIYNRYFRYERNKLIRHGSVLFSLIAGGVLVILGVALPMEVLLYIGAIAISLVLCWLLYSIIRFRIGINKALHHYDKYVDGEYRFVFAFDENGFVYHQSDVTSEIKWEYLSGYRINGLDAYLYNKVGELMDIISADIIGDEHYKQFTEFLLLKSSVKGRE